MAKKFGVGYKRFKVFPADIIQSKLPDIAKVIEDKVDSGLLANRPKKKVSK